MEDTLMSFLGGLLILVLMAHGLLTILGFPKTIPKLVKKFGRWCWKKLMKFIKAVLKLLVDIILFVPRRFWRALVRWVRTVRGAP